MHIASEEGSAHRRGAVARVGGRHRSSEIARSKVRDRTLLSRARRYTQVPEVPWYHGICTGARTRTQPNTKIRLTARKRAALLDSGEDLGKALRCPPIRCVSEFVLDNLADAEGVIRSDVKNWLVSSDRAQLKELEKEHLELMGPHWPLKQKTYEIIVNQTLLGYHSTSPRREKWRNSVPGALRALHEARVSNGAAGLFAYDHYCETQPGPWFRLFLLYRLTMKLRLDGVIPHDGLYLPAEVGERDAADCPICRKSVAGDDQMWYHLEPCRHWMCDACGEEYMQKRATSECPLCKQRIVQYVSALSGV